MTLVNRNFRSSIFDSSIFHKTHRQSDHRLMVSKMSLLLSLDNSPVKVMDHFHYLGSTVYPGLGSHYEDKQSLSHRSWLVHNDVMVEDLNKCNLLGD